MLSFVSPLFHKVKACLMVRLLKTELLFLTLPKCHEQNTVHPVHPLTARRGGGPMDEQKEPEVDAVDSENSTW